MFDFSHLFPGGIYPGDMPGKPKPVRTPEELAESLLRWKCSEYAPGVQCHFCDDCKVSNPCGLCMDLRDAASLLNEIAEDTTLSKGCIHDEDRKCHLCRPIQPGSQD